MKASFSREADLCSEFVKRLPSEWTAFPETAGYDLVLLGRDGVQIAVEAKLTLNAKVLSQLVDRPNWQATQPGAHFRAALVPFGRVSNFHGIAQQLGLSVIEQHDEATFAAQKPDRGKEPVWFSPALPTFTASPKSVVRSPRVSKKQSAAWPEWSPVEPLALPDIVPNLIAGVAAPKRMTAWKIKAIRLGVLVGTRGWVNRHDFARLDLSMNYWIRTKALINVARNRWEATEDFPDLKGQFPDEWQFALENRSKWAATEVTPHGLWNFEDGLQRSVTVEPLPQVTER